MSRPRFPSKDPASRSGPGFTRATRSVLCVAAALLSLATTARAQSLDIAWNSCPGGASASLQQNFACAGPATEVYSLHFTFSTPVALPDFVGLAAIVDLYAPGPLAPFWHFENGGCQGGAIPGVTVSYQAPASGDCVTLGIGDICDGNGSCFGGIASYGANFQTPGRGRFVIGATRLAGAALNAGTPYWAWQMDFTTANRGACAGCGDPALIQWQSATALSDDGSPPLDLVSSGTSSSCVAINGGTLANCTVTPVRGTTWGRIKALYR